MFDDSDRAAESGFSRNELLEQIAAATQSSFVATGLLDVTSCDIFKVRIFRSYNAADVDRAELLPALRDSFSKHFTDSPVHVAHGGLRGQVWVGTGQFKIALGKPVGGLRPVLALPAEAWSEDPGKQAILRIATSYLQQKLIEHVYTRPLWPDGLVEATLRTLSLRFILVDAKAQVYRDGRLKDVPAAGDPAWIVVKNRLTLASESERTRLSEAIRLATALDSQASIISVSTLSGAKRLAAVAPLARADPPLAMILFERAGTDHAALREHFFNAHSLTASERRVGHLVLDGETLHRVAEATELSLETVRSYVKRVLAKTGTHRQSELVALYYRSILPVGASIAKSNRREQAKLS